MPMLLLMPSNFSFSWTSKKSLCLLLKKYAEFMAQKLSLQPYASLLPESFKVTTHTLEISSFIGKPRNRQVHQRA